MKQQESILTARTREQLSGSRVLMIGWEFPPLQAGGLGVACEGLVRALRLFIDITFVVPVFDERMQMEGVRVMGMDREAADLEITSAEWGRLSGELPQLDYYMLDARVSDELRAGFLKQEYLKRASMGEVLGDGQVYGPELMRKVATYAEAVAAVFGKGEFDLIHAHDWLTYPAAVRLKKKTGKPLLLHVHALETDRAGPGVRNAIYQVERFGLHMCDRVIAVSEYTRNLIVEHYQVPADKIEAVHNGIDPQKVFRAEHHVPEKIVAFVGRLTHQKGPFFLLETAMKVIARYPEVRFVVAGTGDKMKEMINWTAYKGLSRHFLFTGHVTRQKVAQLLSVADVYFMPSVSEPFGLSAVEAAQFGIPCVISRQSGVSELLVHALKADYWDTDTFAEHIIRLLTDSIEHGQQVGLQNGDLQNISWDLAAAGVILQYRKFLHKI
jgi:glycosyltransferase involved in cell wall biosynthesis